MNPEVVELRRLLDIEKSYRLEVEEERNFLLKDNEFLRQQLATLKVHVPTHVTQAVVHNHADVTSIVISPRFEAMDRIVTHVKDASGGKNVICCAFATIPLDDVSHATPNDLVLCGGVDNSVSVYKINGELMQKLPMPAPVISMDTVNDSVACGMMDGSHAIFRLTSSGDAVVAVRLEQEPAPSDEDIDGEAVITGRRHTKQVVVVKWSEDGRFLCALSHDKQVNLYKRSTVTGLMELYQNIQCSTTPESAAFVPVLAVPDVDAGSSLPKALPPNKDVDPANALEQEPELVREAENMEEFVSQLLQRSSQRGSDGLPPSGDHTTAASGSSSPGENIRHQSSIEIHSAGTTNVKVSTSDSPTVCATDSGCSSSCAVQYELVLGMRDVSYLTYIHCGTLQARQVSLNEHAWDTHVSVTPLYLAPNPSGDRLLVATDKHMHIVLRTGTNERLQILSGHSCGDYGKPVVQWDRRGEYVYCNSDDDNTVKVYSITTGKLVQSLAGHGKGIVRSLATHQNKPLIVSASYDKSIIVWGVK